MNVSLVPSARRISHPSSRARVAFGIDDDESRGETRRENGSRSSARKWCRSRRSWRGCERIRDAIHERVSRDVLSAGGARVAGDDVAFDFGALLRKNSRRGRLKMMMVVASAGGERRRVAGGASRGVEAAGGAGGRNPREKRREER